MPNNIECLPFEAPGSAFGRRATQALIHPPTVCQDESITRGHRHILAG